jgi:tetratricopeptide (TPR) repeat protein
MPPEPQHKPTMLYASAQGEDFYRFSLQIGERTTERVISRDLPASISEDLRLLRWQAVGLVDNGDAFLEIAGKRLGALILREEEREEWRTLLRSTRRFIIRFESGAEALLNLPWELLNLGEGFVLRDAGCHIIREIPSKVHDNIQASHATSSVIHVSLGVDSLLRLDQERCSLLDVLPANVPITFLLNPTIDEFTSAAESAEPDIVIISGHGAYNDLTGAHSLATLEGDVETRQFVHIAADAGCSLLLLWTCESARLGTALNLSTEELTSPPDLISFTYPVAGGTALEAIKLLLEKLTAGLPADEAAAATRDVDFLDSYAFFNLVHYHHAGRPFFQLNAAGEVSHSASAPLCEGREFALTVLDVKSHENEVVTVIAPVGCDALSLLKHFNALGSRSPFEHSIELSDPNDLLALRASRGRVQRVIVTGLVETAEVGCTVVRYTSPSEYDGAHHDGVMILSDLEGAAIGEALEQKLGSRSAEIENHPLAGVPSFVDSVAAGTTPSEAQADFENANRMVERMSGVSAEGKLVASWLYIVEVPMEIGESDYEQFALGMSRFEFSSATFAKGIVDCLALNVIIRMDTQLILSPDFRLLGETWFPTWRTDHLRPFQLMVAAFATIDSHSRFDEPLGRHLLDWAERIEAWREATMLCIRLCMEYGGQGRLGEMEPLIRRILPHVEGEEEKLVLDGHLLHIMTNEGRYAEVLSLHEQIEVRARALPHDGEEYYINLIASLTQQVDCLLALDHLSQAKDKWQESMDLYARWASPTADAYPRLLALKAQTLAHSADYERALETINEALAAGAGLPGILLSEFHAVKCEYLVKSHKLEEAAAEMELAQAAGDVEAFAPRYLHLKGLLLEAQQDPSWVEHILESYERDRLAGRWEGVAISLLTVARIFIDAGEYERARERLKEVFAYIRTFRMSGQIATFMLLWGEVETATKSPAEGRPWINLARSQASSEGQERVVQRAERILA